VRYDDDIANIRKLQETQQQAVSALAGTVSALTETAQNGHFCLIFSFSSAAFQDGHFDPSFIRI